MANIFNDIDELIGKYLASEASAEERLFVEKWLAQSESNRHYFRHLKTIFETTPNVKGMPHFDTDAAWNKLKSKLEQSRQTKTRSLKPDTFGVVWRIAASVLLIVGIGYFAYVMMQQSTSLPPMEVITKTTTQADTLPDGSSVFLNKETQLAYSFDDKAKTHRVKLKGEAYFEIHHEEEKTFIVDAEGLFIKDIGTAFNIKAYPNSATVEVFVEEGEVIFYSDNDKGVSLVAGEQGIYNKSTRAFSVIKPETNITAYKSKQFVFNNSDLGSIVEQLNRIYEKQIMIDETLTRCRLTVSFNNEDLEEIVNVIAETLGLAVKSTEQTFMLEGEGCEN